MPEEEKRGKKFKLKEIGGSRKKKQTSATHLCYIHCTKR